MKHLTLEVVRVTEAAAIAASAWIGTGEKELADKAATDAMRGRLNRMAFNGIVVIGEGIKDKSAGLFAGERVGMLSNALNARGQLVDSRPCEICVDPIEGTRPTVTSGPEAMSVIGFGSPGSLFATEDFYAKKLAFGPKIKSHIPRISLSMSLGTIVREAAHALKKPVDHFTVCLLDRPRHQDIISELREIGCRIKLMQDCDVSGALATCIPDSGVDVLYSIGGAPEAVITACAMKCMGGEIQAQMLDENMKPRAITLPGRSAPSWHLNAEDMVQGDCVFAATGITSGSLLKGVRFTDRGPVTSSVFMRSGSRTIRWMTAEHGA